MNTASHPRSRAQRRSVSILAVTLIITLGIAAASTTVVVAASGCATSTPPSGAYSVTLCFTTPSDGGNLSGNVTVTPSTSVTGANPGIQRLVYYIDGQYLLTSYQSPYNFSLNTALWVDGVHNLAVEALMRDSYTTANRGSINVTFTNGVTTPPVNNNHFTPSLGTTPLPGSPLIVAASGDGASGETNSLNVSNLIASWNPNLFLYLGDVYEKGSLTEFNNWYGSGSSYFNRFMSITNPTIGNHEYSSSNTAAGYFFYWNNVPNYYSYNIAGWHFVSLNSNYVRMPVQAGSAQYNWLSADLAANTLPCTLVYYHQPLYNIGQEPAQVAMTDIWQLMAQDKVTLVINGHDHDYQRWTAMDGSGTANPNGVTEFVVGTAGHGYQTFTTSDSRMLVGYDSSNKQYGALRLELNPSSANFKFINTSGAVKDSGTINCQGSIAPTPTPTVTNTPAGTNTPTPTAANTSTPTPANTATNTPLPTATSTPTTVPTATPTALPTNTPTTAPTPTDTPIPLPTNTPTITFTPSLTPTATNTPSTFTFNPQADAYVNAASPTTNFGSSKTLYEDSSPIEHSYVRFNVTGLGGAPTKATLKLFANSTSSTGFDVFSVSDNSWVENAINYSNAPAFAATKTGSSGAIKTAGSWISVDVTALVSGNGLVSFGLSTTSGTAINLSSRESGANAPQLVITP
jgi:hypothetical protein